MGLFSSGAFALCEMQKGETKAIEVRYDTVEKGRLFTVLDSLENEGWMLLDLTVNEKTGLCIIKSGRETSKSGMPPAEPEDFIYDKEQALAEGWHRYEGWEDGIYMFPHKEGRIFYWLKDGYVLKAMHDDGTVEHIHQVIP